MAFEGEENLCAACSHQAIVKGLGLGQTENLMFSLLHPGYLQHITEIAEVCRYMDSVILKSDVENVLPPFMCAFVLSFSTKKLNRCVLGSAVTKAVAIRQNF